MGMGTKELRIPARKRLKDVIHHGIPPGMIKKRNQEVADRTESKIREPETGNYHKEKRWNFKSTLKKV